LRPTSDTKIFYPMRWSQLPPVGNPIHSVASTSDPFASWPSLQVAYVDSGTTALALAIKSAMLGRGSARTEVILPGYCCPDLVAACLWAGAKPVLVDLASSTPWMDLDEVRSACSAATVAILAVNFLGLRERIAELAGIAADNGAALIEDCAQWFPDERADLPADFTIASFGRGKPVSLLGGGVLLARSPILAELPHDDEGINALLHIKARAYNWLLRPFLYGALSRVIGSRLGQTQFHSLQRTTGMDPVRRRWLSANVAAYRQRDDSVVRLLQARLAALESSRVIDLARLPGSGTLLRYPLLMPTARETERAERLLHDAGLGASRMYRSILPRIASVPVEALTIFGSLEHSEDFAGRLLTLPVHQGVREADVMAMTEVLSGVLKRPGS
jgi:dTDP-4-amino-4,6-dideoxygalactose transaminase